MNLVTFAIFLPSNTEEAKEETIDLWHRWRGSYIKVVGTWVGKLHRRDSVACSSQAWGSPALSGEDGPSLIREGRKRGVDRSAGKNAYYIGNSQESRSAVFERGNNYGESDKR